jgi:hypothetical protein
MTALSALVAIPAELPCLAFMFDRRLAKAASQVWIVARIGLQPRYAGKLLIVNWVTDHFHHAILPEWM